jgi:hypothetical protein
LDLYGQEVDSLFALLSREGRDDTASSRARARGKRDVQ